MNSQRLRRGPFRVVCDFDLTFDAPLHIGTGERFAALTDMPILRLPDNSPWLPGSSLRGALRDWCEREAPLLGVGTQSLHRLFGATPKLRQREDLQGRLTVEGATLEGATTLRDHVVIRHEWGAAARGGKFDEELLHAEEGRIRWVYEGDGPSDPELRLLRSAAWALEHGLIALGGRKAVGFGRVKGKLHWQELSRDQPAGLATYLSERLSGEQVNRGGVQGGIDPYAAYASAPSPDEDVCRDSQCPPWSILDAKLRIQFDGPMLVAATVLPEDSAVDDAWFRGPGNEPVLPGSSLRGVLLHHAFRIARSLSVETGSDVFERAARLLWGWVDSDGGQQGMVSIGDGTLAPGETPQRLPLSHVAIDRITHFAADKKLFFTEALASPAFRCPLLIRWQETPQSSSGEQRLALALLFFTLRELEEGLVWAGSRTTRGYGYVASSRVEDAWCSRVRDSGRDSTAGKSNGSVAAIAQHTAIEDVFAEWTAHLTADSVKPIAEAAG